MKSARLLGFILIFIGLNSCGEFQKIYKSKSRELKYNKAMQLYQEKDYARSVQLLEQLRDIYRNRDSLENVYYNMSMCYYELKDYSYASLFFKDYTENFTQSDRVIECAYMALYCDFLDIGPNDLDQSRTKDVIGALQLFTNYYPDSEYTDKCNNHIDALREKLQEKEYAMVIQYYRMGEYRAAVTSARNAVKMYPDIDAREELDWITVDAQYQFAKNSIRSKKLERLEEVLQNIEDYVYNHNKESDHFEQVMEIKNKATKTIKEIKRIS
ncbi:outer membrane protein assembly factor BamD [Bacteroidia bacterium]|nr:outer membrane protein assembly factor BamD [Bacteroidia bacterium]